MSGTKSAAPDPNPAAIRPDARPSLSGNHFNPTIVEPQYTSAAPTPASEYRKYNPIRVCAYPMADHPTAHITPPTDINTRGPRRSMNRPAKGWTQVSNAMNSVKPHCTADNFQPVAAMIGFTNSAQAY